MNMIAPLDLLSTGDDDDQAAYIREAQLRALTGGPSLSLAAALSENAAITDDPKHRFRVIEGNTTKH
jgi:hypothetical protein